MSTVVVTGGAGYVGSHAVKALAAAGYDVVVYDDLSAGHAEAVDRIAAAFPSERFRWSRATSLDRAAFGRVLAVDGRHGRHAFRGPAAGRGVGSRADRILSRERHGHDGACSTRWPTRASNDSSSRPRRPRSASRRESPIDETASAASHQRLRRDEARDRAGAARTSSARRACAGWSLRYFNAAGADPDGLLGEDHDPEEHLIPLAHCGRARRHGRSRSSARTTRRRTAPASATTSTWRTWPTRTSRRSAALEGGARVGRLQSRQRRRACRCGR